MCVKRLESVCHTVPFGHLCHLPVYSCSDVAGGSVV